MLWPYSSLGDIPQQPPTILGARVETDIYRVREEFTSRADGFSPGGRIRFVRNGVVTGIIALMNVPKLLSFDCGLEVIKNGHEHLFTDGHTPQTVHPAGICVGSSNLPGAGTPWARVCIPVDAGEIWTIRMLQENFFAPSPPFEASLRYSFAVRCERFLEKPQTIPDWLPCSTIYHVKEDLEANERSSGIEMDFREDGIVTGIRAASLDGQNVGGNLSNVELDILRRGTDHLSMGDQTLFPIDCNEMSTDGWFQIWNQVSQHEKWQIFATNRHNFATSYRFTARVEERRRPWERW